MNRPVASGACFALLLLVGGCAKSRPVASMGVLRAQPAPMTLGAGDALGKAVYVNDLLIAARYIPDDLALANLEATRPHDERALSLEPLDQDR